QRSGDGSRHHDWRNWRQRGRKRGGLRETAHEKAGGGIYCGTNGAPGTPHGTRWGHHLRRARHCGREDQVFGSCRDSGGKVAGADGRNFAGALRREALREIMSSSVQSRFSESDFADMIRSALQNALPEMRIERGACLLYKLHFDGEGNVCPNTFQSPVRGQLAFETDILIRNSNVPLIAIELKFGHFTTHDVLTYSTKALRHKELYPYLRYGFVVGGIKKIQNRFFTHDAGFDFAFMFEDPNSGLPKLIAMVKQQLEISQQLRKLGDSEFSSFETLIQLS